MSFFCGRKILLFFWGGRGFWLNKAIHKSIILYLCIINYNYEYSKFNYEN